MSGERLERRARHRSTEVTGQKGAAEGRQGAGVVNGLNCALGTAPQKKTKSGAKRGSNGLANRAQAW